MRGREHGNNSDRKRLSVQHRCPPQGAAWRNFPPAAPTPDRSCGPPDGRAIVRRPPSARYRNPAGRPGLRQPIPDGRAGGPVGGRRCAPGGHCARLISETRRQSGDRLGFPDPVPASASRPNSTPF